MKRHSLSDRYCAIARSSSELTDGWTFVILREIMLSNKRFDGLQAQTGMSPRSLTLRLKSLVDNQILEKIPYQEKPLRFEYRLTEKGRDLWPVMITLKQWGEKWCGPWQNDEYPMEVKHRGKSHSLNVEVRCADCNEVVDVFSGETHINPIMQKERDEMADAHAAGLASRKKKKL
ncbi:MAG: helix-turn-helix transcriptional regulator [Sneathiellales bacterium]|nr:helix-turn-helix transcriptional regulator [Sneathiellales bacterium]